MAFLSVYTPQSQHSVDVRMEFFTQLEAFYSSISVNGQKIILGDMNSRLRCKFANEDTIIGDYFFRGIQKMPEAQANRNFLAQFCHSTGLLLANTYFAMPSAALVTYYEIGATPMEEIRDNKYAQLDFILCETSAFVDIAFIKSIRELAFASHHFILLCEMTTPFQLEKCSRQQRSPIGKIDYTALQSMDIQQNFVEHFKQQMEASSFPRNINEQLLDINSSLRHAARQILPEKEIQKLRPWISSKTLELIEARNYYKRLNDTTQEKALSRDTYTHTRTNKHSMRPHSVRHTRRSAPL